MFKKVTNESSTRNKIILVWILWVLKNLCAFLISFCELQGNKTSYVRIILQKTFI